jgi:hypothetical protein
MLHRSNAKYAWVSKSFINNKCLQNGFPDAAAVPGVAAGSRRRPGRAGAAL